MRLETDQFLLACVELKTFVNWLDRIFAAIDVAAPLDEREFPRDQSIPRIQRIRWLRGQRPRPEDNSTGFPLLSERRESDASQRPGVGTDGNTFAAVGESAIDEDDEDEGEANADGDNDNRPGNGPPIIRSDHHPIVGRLSTTSYPNENIDPDTGKWVPRTKWTETHDQLYAKLCYAVLLFKSPRKTNYVISGGKRWYVDWESGRMIRLLPPAYGEDNMWGPWQVIAPENRLI